MKINEIKIGISSGVTWAWGVSLGVGLKILTTMGVKAFVIWALANTLALSIFGFFAARYPVYLEFQKNKYLKFCMMIIQVFCIWVNAKILIDFIPLTYAIAVIIITFAVTYIYKFKFVVNSNQFQYIAYLLSLILIISTKKTYVPILLDETNFYWLIPASIGLLCGPFLDGQHFQRMRIVKNDRPYYIGSVVFGIYMLLIFFAGQSKGPFGDLLLMSTIIWVVTSTVNSCISSMQEMVGDKNSIIVSICALIALPLFYQQSVISVWSWYAIGRIFIVVPLVFVTWRANGRVKNTGIPVNRQEI